jgi:hypothetical protein
MVAEALADLLGIFALGESEDVHILLFPRYLRTSRSSSSATPTAQGEALIRIRFSGSGGQYRAIDIQRWFASSQSSGSYGRLPDMVAGPDGAFHVLTSNRYGRGRPRPGDDHILRITLSRFR